MWRGAERISGKGRSRSAGFSRERSLGGCDFNIHSIDVARALFSKNLQNRYRPLAAFVGGALGHRVMIVENGANWQKSHDALMPAFTPSQVTKRHAPEIRAVAEETFSDLATRCASTGGRDVAVEPLMRIAIARVMGHVVFGRRLSVEEADMLQWRLEASTQLVRRGAPALANRVLATLFRLFGIHESLLCVIPRAQRRTVAELLAWIERKIDTGRRAGDAMPIIDALERRFADRAAAAKGRCVAAECAMLFIAGVETTAAALTFALAEIASHPDLRDEIMREARGAPSEAAEEHNLAEQFPAMHRVVYETLRRHTIVPTMLREAADDCALPVEESTNGPASAVVPRGSTLRFLPMQAHLNKSVWPDPQKFDPLRFSSPLTPEQQKNYNPFGIGPQACMGRTLAIVEIVLFLAALFRHLDVAQKQIVHAIPVQRNALFTNRPIGVTLRFSARRERTETP